MHLRAFGEEKACFDAFYQVGVLFKDKDLVGSFTMGFLIFQFSLYPFFFQ